MTELVKKFFKDEEGAAAVEYALLVSLIGVALIVTIQALEGGIAFAFGKATTQLNK